MSSLVGVLVLVGEDKDFFEARKLLSKLQDGRSHMCRPGGLDVTGRGQRPESETYEWVVIFSLLIESSFKF